MKRGFHTAFPTFSTYYAAGSAVYNAFKRQRAGFTITGNNPHEKNMAWKSRKRIRRGGSRTIRKRGKFRGRGRRLVRKVRRINRGLFRKGIKAVEIKYNQSAEGTTNGNTGANVVYGITESVFQANANAFPLTNKVAVSSGITLGTARDSRVGNKIFIRHLRIRGGVSASNDALAANEIYVKIMVVRVKEAQGNPTTAVSTVPTADNYFDSILAGGTRWNGSGVNTTVAGGIDNRARDLVNFTNTWKWMHARWGNDFQILKTKVIKISKETGINAEKKLFKMNIPIFKPAHWDGPTSTDPQDGHIYIYYYSTQASQNMIETLANMPLCRPVLGFTWRLSFTDV